MHVLPKIIEYTFYSITMTTGVQLLQTSIVRVNCHPSYNISYTLHVLEALEYSGDYIVDIETSHFVLYLYLVLYNMEVKNVTLILWT